MRAAEGERVGVGVVELCLLWLLVGAGGRDLETAGKVVWIGVTSCCTGRGERGSDRAGATHAAFLRWNAIMRSAMSVGWAGSRRLLMVDCRDGSAAHFRPSAVTRCADRDHSIYSNIPHATLHSRT